MILVTDIRSSKPRSLQSVFSVLRGRNEASDSPEVAALENNPKARPGQAVQETIKAEGRVRLVWAGPGGVTENIKLIGATRRLEVREM